MLDNWKLGVRRFRIRRVRIVSLLSGLLSCVAEWKLPCHLQTRSVSTGRLILGVTCCVELTVRQVHVAPSPWSYLVWMAMAPYELRILLA